MTNQQERVLEACRRVQAFMDANATLLDTINKSATRSELDGVVANLGNNAGAQATAHVTVKGETANKTALRQALLDHMRRIAAVAALRLEAVPQFEALKAPNTHSSASSLVALATAMGNTATPYEQTFLDAGLPADFLATLGAAASALSDSSGVRNTARATRSNATGSLKQAASRGRTVLKALNPIVLHALSPSPNSAGLVAEWKAVRHVSAKLGPVAASMPGL